MSTLTLKILDLLKTEFTETQARAIAEAIDKNIEEAQKKESEKFVTKERLYETEKTITSELSSIKQEMGEIKQDIAVINNRLTNIETNFATKSDMKEMKFDMIKWVMIVFSLNIITIISAIFAIVKFVAK